MCVAITRLGRHVAPPFVDDVIDGVKTTPLPRNDDVVIQKHNTDRTEGFIVERGGSDPRSASVDISPNGDIAEAIHAVAEGMVEGRPRGDHIGVVEAMVYLYVEAMVVAAAQGRPAR